MIFLSVVFITYIPNMLSAGNKIGTIRNAFSDVLKLKLGKEKATFLSIRYTTIISAITARLKHISSGTVDSGDLYPKLSDKLFSNSPKNIKNEMLNPTDNTTFSVDSILFNLSIWRINSPGKIVRKRNPKICLMNGMFKSIVKSVKRSIAIANVNHPLDPNLNALKNFLAPSSVSPRIIFFWWTLNPLFSPLIFLFQC